MSIGVRKSLIQRMQAWLVSQGGAATAAACIAELIGGKDIATVLHLSRKTLKYVSCGKVFELDMKDNKPNVALKRYSKRATLGYVDAFISHSWHDDPEKKWVALQAWRDNFKKAHGGREPRLWIDKYCIDQENKAPSFAKCGP